jgi:hypothetical protein
MSMRASDQHKQPFITGALVRGAALLFLAALSTSASCALAQAVAATPVLAQSSAKLSNPGGLAKNSAALKTSSKPAWQDLTSSQQLSLKPLAANWNTMGEAEKRKWIAIAMSYPTLAPAEQAKLHSRMNEWVSLSQQQRAQARLNFAQSKELAPTQKTATWQAYQALSPEEKKKLAISATPKPAGAATAVKPVPPQKLTVVPVTRQTSKQTPRMAAANHAVNRNTLLPHSQPPVELAPTQKN